MSENKTKKYIIIGLVGAFITIIGEMLQGAVPSTDTTDKFTTLFSSFENLPVWRIGLGSTVGVIGIFLQFFGMYSIYLTFSDKETKLAKVYKIGMYVFSIFGAIVHLLMSVMVYTYKISMEHMIDFTIWFVIPLLVLFFVGYIPFCVSMAIQFWKKQTQLPKWLFWLNPLFGKVFFNIVTAILPSCAIVNGIAYSNMGLSSIILFLAVLICILKKKSN